MSQWLQEQEAKLKQVGSSPEMSAFADVKDDKTLKEWLHVLKPKSDKIRQTDRLSS